jgi:hypothetical protein
MDSSKQKNVYGTEFLHSVPYTFFIRLWMPVPLTPSVDKNWITARWACLEGSMARSLTVILLLFQSTTHCRHRVYNKFLLIYTAIYRRNRKVLPLGITALQHQSHFHLGAPYRRAIVVVLLGCVKSNQVGND